MMFKRLSRVSVFATIISALFILGICAFNANALQAADQSLKNEQVINLWPGVAPGSENVKLTEKGAEVTGDPKELQRTIEGVLVPTMTAFVPKKPNGAAALIFPGGGYTNIVFDKEGTDIAKWLSSIGITAFVLKARLPGEGHVNGKNVPLQDAQRAFRIIRKNAEKWGLDTTRLGIVGLSSGGHFASMLATNYGKKVYTPIDDIDEVSAHPEWCVLAYPPISGNARAYLIKQQPPMAPVQKQELYDEYPTDKQVTKDTPRTFIVQGNDDAKVDPENGVRFYLALHRIGVPAEIHIFIKGVHGFAIRNATGPIKAWTKMCEDWMKEVGVFK
jgi:acetyl esterase/lipase